MFLESFEYTSDFASKLCDLDKFFSWIFLCIAADLNFTGL